MLNYPLSIVLSLEKTTPNNEVSEKETPWRFENNGADVEKLYSLTQRDEISRVQAKNLDKIFDMQNPDGGYPWFKGMSSSPQVTMLMLESYNSLTEIGYLKAIKRNSLKPYAGAMMYLDDFAVEQYNKENNIFASTILDYLYIRSLYMESIDFKEEFKAVYDKYIVAIKKNWREYPLLERVIIASTLNNLGHDVVDIVSSIKEYAVKDGDNGVYFPNLVLPFKGVYHSEIRAHSLILQLFGKLPVKDSEFEGELAKWLIIQRRTQLWGDNSGSIFAIASLWKYYDSLPVSLGKCGLSLINKSDYIPSNDMTTLGYIFDLDKMRANKSDYIASVSNSEGVFVDIEYSYEQQLSQIKPSGNGFSVERRMYRVDGSEIKLVDGNNRLKIGDEVVVRYFIDCKYNSSFVQLKATRTGALKPVKDRSGYEKNYYREVRKNESVFNFYLLSAGNHIIEERFFVDFAGDFNDGYVMVSSLFNPIINANNSSEKIFVQKNKFFYRNNIVIKKRQL